MLKVVLISGVLLLSPFLLTGQVRAEEVRYSSHIKPILDKHCVECHSGWFPDGGLSLESLEDIREGGRQGAAVIPGKPEKGWLINLVRSAPGRYSKMPPGPKQLSDTDIQLIQRWIAGGARP